MSLHSKGLACVAGVSGEGRGRGKTERRGGGGRGEGGGPQALSFFLPSPLPRPSSFYACHTGYERLGAFHSFISVIWHDSLIDLWATRFSLCISYVKRLTSVASYYEDVLIPKAVDSSPGSPRENSVAHA